MTYDPRRRKEWRDGDKTPLDIFGKRLESSIDLLYKLSDEYGDAEGFDRYVQEKNLLDHELLLDLIYYSKELGEPLPLPLPAPVLEELAYELERAMSGYDGQLFRKFKKTTKHSAHPYSARLQGKAVDYISVCQETGWDRAYIKILQDVYDVGRSTVQRWKNKCPLTNLGHNIHRIRSRIS